MSIEQIDAELARLQAEIASVERLPRSFDEVWPATEAELDQAEATFRRIGPQLGFVSQLPEHVYERRQAMVGMVMVANRPALIDAERARIKAATAGGLSQADRTKRLDQLRAAILMAAARKEIALRQIEGTEFQMRSVHPEFVVFRRAEVERIAAAR